MFTFHEIYSIAGGRFRVYDMSRGMRPVSLSVFKAFENEAGPWPWPHHDEAMLALAAHTADSSDLQIIRFLRLPLDSRHYMAGHALGRYFAEQHEQFLHDALSGTADAGDPFADRFSWRPSLGCYFSLWAMARKAFRMPLSDYYQQAAATIDAGVPGRTHMPAGLAFDWTHDLALPEPGLGEILAHPEQRADEARAIRLIGLSSAAMLFSLAAFLLHVRLTPAVQQALIERMEEAIEELPAGSGMWSQILPALRSAGPTPAVVDLVGRLTYGAPHQHHVEVFGETLNYLPHLMTAPGFDTAAFFERFAACPLADRGIFAGMFADLLQEPGTEVLISPERMQTYGERTRRLLASVVGDRRQPSGPRA